MQIVPNSWGALREFNQCHAPGGSPSGGEFCSTGDSNPIFDSYPPNVANTLRGLQKTLLAASGYEPGIFGRREQGEHTSESMAVVDWRTGDQIGKLIPGVYKEVQVLPPTARAWAAHGGPLINIHTHPSGSPFSLNDVVIFNTMNAQAQAVNGGTRPLFSNLFVYGSDGSVFEIKLPKVFNEHELKALIADHQTYRLAAEIKSIVQSERVMLQRLGKKGSPPLDESVRETLKRDYFKATHEYGEALNEKHFQVNADGVWKKLASQHGFTYRSYLVQRDGVGVHAGRPGSGAKVLTQA